MGKPGSYTSSWFTSIISALTSGNVSSTCYYITPNYPSSCWESAKKSPIVYLGIFSQNDVLLSMGLEGPSKTWEENDLECRGYYKQLWVEVIKYPSEP